MKKYVRVILLLLLILLNLHHCPLHAGAANTNAPLPISGNEGVDRQIHIVGRRAVDIWLNNDPCICWERSNK
ncbi:unnamed protein product [Cuscuta campestris]|uniref:Uncharacterized protein n=1 Tax=Cuscuta campestris TaxID=132261 RepID=A0A484NPE5_9ASTE|nr:unnamed protein product [Cuscuta campestris]